MPIGSSEFMNRLWDVGQQHLAAGRYVAARIDLEIAERQAWRRRDAEALARIYLPLLETRRQIRYLAAEGKILIATPAACAPPAMRQFFTATPATAGTLILVAGRQDSSRARGLAKCVRSAVQRAGQCAEVLLVIQHATENRLVSLADPHFAAGIPVNFTAAPGPALPDTASLAFAITLPPPGTYGGESPGPGEMARESILLAWEALALKWQRRHPLKSHFAPAPHSQAAPDSQSAWQEIDRLRSALRLDPACEPISMRIMSLAESLARQL